VEEKPKLTGQTKLTEFHFSKRFKQIVGVNPREYRRQIIE